MYKHDGSGIETLYSHNPIWQSMLFQIAPPYPGDVAELDYNNNNSAFI